MEIKTKKVKKMSAVKKLIAGIVQEKRQALGNSKRGLKELASDLLNEDIGQNKKRRQFVSNSCFLNIHTIERVMDCDENYRPMSDTLERILKYYDIRLTAEYEPIKAEFQNKPKVAKGDLIHDDYEM